MLARNAIPARQRSLILPSALASANKGNRQGRPADRCSADFCKTASTNASRRCMFSSVLRDGPEAFREIEQLHGVSVLVHHKSRETIPVVQNNGGHAVIRYDFLIGIDD